MGRGAPYNTPFKAGSSQPLSLRTVPKPPHVRSLCPRVRLGLGIGKAGGSTYRSPLQKPSFPASGSMPVFCSAQHIAPTFSSMCTAAAAFIWFILGSHKLFPRTYNARKDCWLRCREENVQSGLARDALTWSLCSLGPFLADCFLRSPAAVHFFVQVPW